MSYKLVKVHLTRSQKQKLIHAKRNGTEVTLRIKNGSEDDKSYLTSRQIEKIKNGKQITLSKTQMSKQTGGFLSAILPILKAALPAPGIAAASGALSGFVNKAVKNKISGKGVITLDIPVNEARLIIETTSELENNNILPKGITEMMNNKMENEQEGGFIGTLLASLAGALLPGLLGGKGLLRAGEKKASEQFRFHELLRK